MTVIHYIKYVYHKNERFTGSTPEFSPTFESQYLKYVQNKLRIEKNNNYRNDETTHRCVN